MNVLRSICAIASIAAFMSFSGCTGGGGEESGTTIPASTASLVADAGQDQSVFVGTFVTLNGSKSTNSNQTGLTYAWALTKPAGSNATLSNPASVIPTMTVDVEGTYEATLIVTDARQTSLSSEPDTVLVIAAKSNLPPTAHAGDNQNVFVGRPVSLDGSRSRASNNKPLTFRWGFTSQPPGSLSTLSSPTAEKPSFTPDQSGPYVLQLVVNDGTNSSTAAEVTITAAVKPRPTADAGLSQAARPGTLITLDGSKSSSATGDPLRFSWSLTVPQGSSAILSKADTQSPTFIADVVGTYVAQLIVNDGTDNSAPATVQITVSTNAPVARAGNNQNDAGVCRTVTLDGSASTDRDGPPSSLAYNWTLSPEPSHDSAKLKNAATVSASFIPELAISYQATLVVKEGELASAPASVTITAKSIFDLNSGSAPTTEFERANTAGGCIGCHTLVKVDEPSSTFQNLSKKGLRVRDTFPGGKHRDQNLPVIENKLIHDFCVYFQAN